MAYVQPNSKVKLYRDIPLDSLYRNTIYFASTSAQTSWFTSSSGGASHIKYNLDQYSYQRVELGKIRVALKADNVYDCNYLSFQNTSYGNKWFYAFITSVEYINDSTTEIGFEIDVMQTYFLDVQMNMCWIEREHTMTDNVGDNTVPEPIDLGDMVCYSVSQSNYMQAYSICVATTGVSDSDMGGIYAGTYSGLTYGSADLTINGADQMNSFLKSMVAAGKEDVVVAIFLAPSFFFKGTKDLINAKKYTHNVSRPSTVGDYTPRNKKLLTYPYNFLSVVCDGQASTFRYEWFEGTAYCQFVLAGTVSPSPEIALIPVNYNGAEGENITEEIVMGNFPQCAWSSDSFAQFLARSGVSTALTIGASTAGLVAGIASGNPVAVGISAVGLANQINSVVTEATKPNKAHGSQGAQIDIANDGKRDFYFRRMGVSEERVAILDDFFDMYGYAVNRIGYPGVTGRPHWNYIKTKDATAKGKAPASAIRKICEIFDNGITFWKNGNEVGNYSYNNGVNA